MKILLISNFFFPNNHVGAVRPTRLYEYLKQKGCEVTVVTTTPEDSTFGNNRTDFSCLEKEIHRIPAGGIRHYSGIKKNSASFNPAGLMRKINIAHVDHHILWVLKVCIKIRKLIGHRSFDWVITTSPEHYNHLIGLMIKKVYHCNWLCDYRDGWTLNPSFNEKNNPIKKMVESFFEKRVIRNCDILSVTSPGLLKEITHRFKPRTHHLLNVMNGYDVSINPRTNLKPKQKNGTINVILAGSIDANRSPLIFFEMLNRLCDEDPTMEDKIHIELIDYIKGTALFAHQVRHAAENAKFHVSWLPFMPIKKLEEYIRNHSDLMLLCLGNPTKKESDYNHWVLSKVFDCMIFKVPALAVIPPTGDTARIIRKTDCGIVIGCNDYSDLKKQIHFLLCNRHKIHELFHFRNVGVYCRDEQFRKISDTFQRFGR